MLLRPARLSGDAGAAWALRDRLDTHPPPLSHAGTESMDGMEYVNALTYFTDLGATDTREADWPLDTAYPRKKVVLLRSSWAGANATFVGFKACNCSWNHGDLDSGSFVFTSGGERIIADWGAGDYSADGYFGDLRFTYFVKGSLGHNTLSFGGLEQDTAVCGGYSRKNFAPAAAAAAAATPVADGFGVSTEVVAFASTNGVVVDAPGVPPLPACALGAGDDACAVVNLTQAYVSQGVADASRTLTLRNGRAEVLVSDRWALAAGTSFQNVTFWLQTRGNVTLSADARSARIVVGAATAYVSVAPSSPCAPASVTFLAARKIAPVGFTFGAVADPAACAGFDIVLGPNKPAGFV
jgi:hypothetical protein